MVASLDGIIFYQVYGDNTGGAEFDTDGDGTATQEDEFVSVQNTGGVPVDLSGWQIWSDMAGAGAPDSPQDGLYHTFPEGTVLQPGVILYIVNEISGTPSANMQEASEGGVESGAGGTNTNFLTEGSTSGTEGVALVNPETGEYIILSLDADSSTNIASQPGFPGTTKVGESNAAADSGVEDQNAGSSYQYNSATESYEYQAVMVTCFAAGTSIAVPGGECVVERLKPGDFVMTLDHGPQMVRIVLKRHLDFEAGADERHKPIEFKPDALGSGRPRRRLIVSPHHRMLLRIPGGDAFLVPAKGLIRRDGVRVMAGRRQVTYVHLVFDRHEIISAEGCWTESFYPGEHAVSLADVQTRRELFQLFPGLRSGRLPRPARPIAKVSETRALASRATAV